MSNIRISRYWELNLYFPFFLRPFSFLISFIVIYLSLFSLQLPSKPPTFHFVFLFLQSLLYPLFQIVFPSLFLYYWFIPICPTHCLILNLSLCFFHSSQQSPHWAMASSFKRFLDHTQRYTTVSRTPLDGWSARQRELYLPTHNTHNTHNKQISMPSMGIEPTISAGERPQPTP